MPFSSLFWNKEEHRLRAFYRILVYLIVAIALTTPIAIGADQLNEFMEKSFINVFIMIGMLLSIYLVGKYVDKRSWSDFGITFLPLRHFLWGIFSGALLMMVIFGIQYLLGWLRPTEFYFNRLAGYSFTLVILGQVIRYVSGSLFEEAFSRGYLLRNIAEGFNGRYDKNKAVLIAYVISSSLFGILHLANDNSSLLSTLNLILIGLLFGWMVIKTGKLHFAIGLHAAWNFFQNNIFGAANSGKKTIASFMTFENSGPSLWTGGDFGPEGGLICTFVIIILLLALIYKSQRAPFQKILD